MNVLRLFTCPAANIESAEQKFVLAAQKGDRSAFDALARNYTPLLRGFLLRRVPQETTDDILQETLLAAWISLPSYSHRARFKAWLLAIAARKCVDFYRVRGRVSVEVPLEEFENEAGMQKDAYAAVDRKQAIQSVLLLLPIEQREVIDLYYYAELSLPEVAQALERNLNTVKYQFYRAHAVVERELSEQSERENTGRGREHQLEQRPRSKTSRKAAGSR